MRLRVLKEFTQCAGPPNRGGFILIEKTYKPGEVTYFHPQQAQPLLDAGLVMEDKSLDGAPERKEHRERYPRR